MGYWYHPEIEEQTIGLVMNYHHNHQDASFRLEFDDGETYVCDYLTDYASENSGELEIEEDDPQFDEFYEVGFLVTNVVQGGPRQPGPRQYLAISYRDFPNRITDADTGHVIYPAA